MRARFLHIADCHLGYRQYNLKERFNDFGRAFREMIQIAIAEKVDFVLLAGDLFHKRSIDALTLNQAVAVLEQLKQAGIPCIAVEGNHEHAYIDDFMGWMQFLAMRDYLILLDAKYTAGVPELVPYARKRGSYVEPVPGLRVHGMRYYGATTRNAVARYAEALCNLPKDGVAYSIFMTHAGLEGELDHEMGGLSMRDCACLRDHADYVALGHIHKPYTRDEWIYNPGSLETCAAAEAAWGDRGYFLVEVDTDRPKPKHAATLKANKRRLFVRLNLKCDLIDSPDMLYAQAKEIMERRARDHNVARLGEEDRPVVDLHLHGVLRFERAGLELTRLEEMLQETFSGLHCMVRNGTTANDLAVEPGETVNRMALERQVLADLFGRDARFQAQSRQWARVALGIKALALEGAAPEAILEELEGQMDRLDRGEVDVADVNGAHQESEQETYANPVG